MMLKREHLMHVFCTLASMVVLAGLRPSSAQAGEIFHWFVGTGNWGVGWNWRDLQGDPGVPGSNDEALVNNGGTCRVSDNRQAKVLYVAKSYTTSGCTIEQSDGMLIVHDDLFIAWGAHTEGDCDLSGGGLLVLGATWIGGHDGAICSGAVGAITNSAGWHTQRGALYLGGGVTSDAGSGTYTLAHQDSGLLAEADIYLGRTAGGSGLLDIQNGEVTAEANLYVGYGGTGTLQIDNAATLAVDGNLEVAGYLGNGTFEIASVDATVEIGGDLLFESWGAAIFTVSDQDGATISMTGSASEFFIEEGATGANLSGLGRLTLIFEGEHDEDNKYIEVAGADEGILGDFDEANFVLKELVVGKDGVSDTFGPVTLYPVDVEDNQDDGEDDEALYVKTLTIEAGGTFKLVQGGVAIYYQNEVTPPITPKRLYMADANLDGKVDVFDLAILGNYFGQTEGMTWANADFNGDRAVDVFDLAILGNWYGSGMAPGMAMGPPLLDYDEDGQVEIKDVYILLSLVAEEGGP